MMLTDVAKHVKKVPRIVKRPKLLEELLASISSSVQKATEGGTKEIIRKLDDFLAEVIRLTDSVRKLASRILTKVTPKLNDTERRLFGELTNGDWSEMSQLALLSYVGAYKNPRKAGSREGAIRSLKGFVAEILFFRSGVYSKALQEARQRADQLGLDGGAIKLIRDIRAITVDAAGTVKREALTDGILAVQRRKDKRWVVLTVFELKSLSNFRDLARGRGRTIKPGTNTGSLLDEEVLFDRILKREGQLSRDYERLSEAVIEFDGRQFPGGELVLSKRTSKFVGILPKGKRLSKNDLERIRREIPTFEQTRHAVRNEILDDLARELLEILSGR